MVVVDCVVKRSRSRIKVVIRRKSTKKSICSSLVEVIHLNSFDCMLKIIIEMCGQRLI
ncbi:unnamed protein product [Meloidogyne enterolobii]|uniref:Uncharacterized protein n=1 Tax=Meloidogyne enterolobii TaxID=390850 RepID=A0ACB1A858_MELEN